VNSTLGKELTLIPTVSTQDGFLVQLLGSEGDDMELRGANIYPVPGHTNRFTVVPIFPPVFYTGSLSCLSTGRKLTWFIDTDRNIYMIGTECRGTVLRAGEWLESKSPFFVPSINACIGFMDWLESEHKRVGKLDSMVQTLIVINDEDSAGFPQWLIEIPYFLERWLDYKSHYKNLCLAGRITVNQ